MRTERATFTRITPLDDGHGGTNGVPVEVYVCPVELIPLKASRTLEAANLSLKPAARILFWVDTAYTPLVGDTVTCQDVVYAVQACQFTDSTRRRYELTGIAA